MRRRKQVRIAKANESSIWTVGGIIAALIILAWFATFKLLPLHITDAAERGQFGDMFGSVNALFSGLAFVGVIVAILLQKEELEAQREELEETRKEFKTQNETLAKQRFENTFFSMVSLHNEIVGSLGLGDAEGRGVINFVYNNQLRKHGEKNINSFKGACSDVFKGRQDVLGHYFRNLHRIFRLIEDSGLDNQLFYSKIIQAQLSDNELMLLFYYSFYYAPGEDFKRFAKKYKLFKELRTEELITPDHLQALEELENISTEPPTNGNSPYEDE